MSDGWVSFTIGTWWVWFPRWDNMSGVRTLTWLCFEVEVVR